MLNKNPFLIYREMGFLYQILPMFLEIIDIPHINLKVFIFQIFKTLVW